MTSYLQRQRKGELQEMATLAGVPRYGPSHVQCSRVD